MLHPRTSINSNVSFNFQKESIIYYRISFHIMIDSNHPLGYMAIGLVMLVSCKFVTKLHMKLIKARIGEANMNKLPNLWKWYEKIFFVVWILLGAGILIFHSLRLF